ncbi:hypothetical protein N0V82_006972 [Gnomoniopsis sp. IMI 355080]|nr:hypothetical protein N0V82_006972 [Gnomoniopsis sp. IMI 355080]
MKCLPTTKIPLARGNILHDWHAEVLCMRAFNHFLLRECKSILTDAVDSPYLCLRVTKDADFTAPGRPQAPFAWRDDVTLHMYCSEAPCGDASMELTIAAQEDATPWEAPLSKKMMEKTGLSTGSCESTPDPLLLGRACFSRLGVVRRKPARPDAPPTLSKSCSDKLAAKQCTSLLSSVTSLLVSPENVYLTSLILPESQYSATAVERCFSPQGRMGSVQGSWEGGYAFQPFEVRTTGMVFHFSRRVDGLEGTKYVASNLAALWTANGLVESIIGGALQGRKQTDPKGGSAVSRKNMWTLAGHIAGQVAGIDKSNFGQGTYKGLKDAEALAERRKVKQGLRAEALKGWVRNIGDEEFGMAL